MKLIEALQQIAAEANLDPTALLTYAMEDRVGGRDTGNWSGMSVFSAEGQIIYALVRALRPARVVEVGVASGGTTTHILSALEANNFGGLWSIDVEANCGLSVPENLRHRWKFEVGDALTATLPDKADFVFEDGAHSYDFTHGILTRLKKMGPRMIVSHDALTHLVYGGFDVLRAFKDVLGTDRTVQIDGAFPGLAYWVNAEYGIVTEEIPTIVIPPIVSEEEPVSSVVPKRKRK